MTPRYTIRELRKAKGLTQTEFAKLIGIHPITVSLYETGRNAPRVTTLRKIASFFEVSADEIILMDKAA